MTFFRGSFVWILAILVTTLAVAQSGSFTYDEAYRIKQKVANGATLSASESRMLQEIQASGITGRPGGRTFPLDGHRPHNPTMDYQASPADYEWVDISTIGTLLPLSLDEMSEALDLGFSFDFYDQPYTQIYVASHGFVTFDPTPPPGGWWVETPLPTIDLPNNAIYALWNDISSSMQGAIYYYQDTANNRFIASWENVSHTDFPEQIFTFEILIYDNGNIVFQYQLVPDNTSCAVGLENAAGDDGLQVCYDGTGDCPLENTAILINQPDGLPNPVSNLAAVANDHDVTLTWLDPTTDTNGNPVTLDSVQIWQGRPGQGVRIGMVLPGTQTFTHFGAPDGNLSYYVRAHATPYWSAARSVQIIVGDPTYVNNFDSDEGQFVADPEEGWAWGPPSIGAHSDPNVWGVGLGGTYPNESDYYVTLDLGLAIISPNATVEFWMYYNTESWFDGVNFQISVDDGQTWTIVEPPNGYPIQPMWNGEPGWSGMSNGWQYVVLDVGAWNGEVPRFRFHFASDFSVTLDGFFFDDMTIWGMQVPTFAPVSGTVAFDGGAGSLTAVLLTSNGLGSPQTNPAADGTYTFPSVLVGQRRVIGSLTGYHNDTLFVNVPEGGVTGANLTLRRVDPPAPTNFHVVSVDNATGFATLNWDDTPDALVDSFRIYRRLEGNPNWSYLRSCVPSQYVDTLTADGIYLYSVTAVDFNVQPPAVESARSNSDVALYGELPPTNMVANGNFDTHIQLSWLAPGINNSYQLAYDDSSSEQWSNLNFPNGPTDYMAVRFTPPSADSAHYPLPVQTLNVYVSTTDPLANVWITPDNGGAPDIDNAWGSWQDVGAEESPGWVTVNVGGIVQLTDASDFWMVWQLPPGLTDPGIGSDQDSPDVRSAETWSGIYPSWIQVAWQDFMARVWVGGDPGWGFVMSVGNASGYSVEHVPHAILAPTVSNRTAERDHSSLESNGKSAAKMTVGPVCSKITAPISTVAQNPFHRGLNGRIEPYSQAPALVYQGRHGGHALDDIQYYKIYRNGTFLVQDTEPPYDDMVQENVPYSYYVTAHYDNNLDSPPSNTVSNVRANMAPSAPTNLAAQPVGGSQMHLTWTDPTVNADGTPCTDLANMRVYRNGTMIGTVAAGVEAYSDTPPQPDQFYTWSVRGIDEVPNVGPEITVYGAVVSPWQVAEYDWVDISQIGVPLTLSLDQYSEALDLGFEFSYFDELYTQVYITSHGFVTFDPTFPPPGWWNETTLPNPMQPNNAIYGLWDDIASSNAGALYYYQDADEGRFIVTYDGIGATGNPGETYTFQIILDDRGGIRFNYQSISQTTSNAIGVENADGTNGVQILFDGDGWIPTNESAITIWGGPAGEISGVVRRSPGNQLLEGVTVSIAQGPEFALTDATGLYRLRLDPGSYSVNFSKPGLCDTTYMNVLVEDDATTILNAFLRSPQAQFSVTSLSLATWPTHDVSQSFQISNNGGLCPLDFVISDTSNWLTANPSSGSVAPDQSVEVWATGSPIGLQPGHDYQSSLRVQHEAIGSPYVIPVTLSISLEGEEPNVLPTEYALYQNYPNPFNAVTSIRFDVPQQSHVKLTLFNVMGQAVATVANGEYEVGRYNVNYDATDLPSGMYLMKLEAGSYTSMKKMMLLK